MMMEDDVKIQTKNKDKSRKSLIIFLIIVGIIFSLFVISYLNGENVISKI